MINVLMEAAQRALQEEFGEKYAVYMEEEKIEGVKPCFFIRWLGTAAEQPSGKRYSRQNEFCIRYFPESAMVQQECSAAADRMFQSLEYITVCNDLFRGTKMKCEMVDGVLNFFVNYDCSMYRTEDEASMESMESGTVVRGGDLYGK